LRAAYEACREHREQGYTEENFFHRFLDFGFTYGRNAIRVPKISYLYPKISLLWMSWLFVDYCLSLPLTEECTPFDETTLVYKVGGKMYAYADMENFGRVAVKCDPDEAVSLREEYPDVTPAWHSSKKHWNDIRTTGDLPRYGYCRPGR